jgi:hypothetical protein
MMMKWFSNLVRLLRKWLLVSKIWCWNELGFEIQLLYVVCWQIGSLNLQEVDLLLDYEKMVEAVLLIHNSEKKMV